MRQATPTRTSPNAARTRSSIDPRVAARRAAVGRSEGRRRLSVLLAFLGIVTLSIVSVMILHSSLLSVKHVRITGAQMTPEREILAASGLTRRPPMIDVNAVAIERAIDGLPWIKTTTLTRSWPDAVAITVTERNPVATFLVAPHVYAVIDETGRVLSTEPTRARGLVPLSLADAHVVAGQSLDARGIALARVAASVPESLLGSISTMEESSSGVRIVLMSGAVCELGQPSELAAKMTALTTLLQTPSVKLGPHGSVDLRVPDAPVVTDG